MHILAHKDALGFDKLITKVQVKHRKSTSDRLEIQETQSIDANSLFVFTGGFISQTEATTRNNNVKFLDLEELMNSIVYWL